MYKRSTNGRRRNQQNLQQKLQLCQRCGFTQTMVLNMLISAQLQSPPLNLNCNYSSRSIWSTPSRGAEVQTREPCLPKQHFNWRVDWSPFEESTKMKHLTFTLYLVKIFPIAFAHANQGTFLETLVHQTLFQGNCLSLGPSRTWSKNYLKISCF